jgi:hypothetical protein
MEGEFPVNLWVAGQWIDTKILVGQELANVKSKSFPALPNPPQS